MEWSGVEWPYNERIGQKNECRMKLKGSRMCGMGCRMGRMM